MSIDSNSNLLVLVGYGSGEGDDFDELDGLGQGVTQTLHLPTQSALLEAVDVSIGDRILSGITAHQPLHVIVLPLFLGASPAKQNTVKLIVEAAQDRWPEIGMGYGQPLGAHSGVVAAYSQLIKDIQPDHARKTALLIVGRGSRDPQSSTETVQMAHLIAEVSGIPFITVETAFYERTQPDIAAGLKRCTDSGAEHVIVVPYVLYEKALYTAIWNQVESLQTQYTAEVQSVAHLGRHAGMIDAICQRYNEALADLIQQENSGLPRSHGHTHGPQGHMPARLSPAVETLLPPRYQDGASVSAEPMGSADLIFDANGQVAWNDIWGSFCDLALAGGPPHRGTLLEPVTLDEVLADPDGYQRVLAELARGIALVTQLPTVSASSGWIGIQCTDDAMALWLLRAIIVENVSVRREGSILYVPAGPQFRLEHEIKNVITVIAKTHHYWTEHLQTTQKENPS